jgi:lipopolysaccharide transport system ATP-binding protein
MNSASIITVENLGKRYTLQHQQREEYTALRDVITNFFTSFGNKLVQPLRRSTPSCHSSRAPLVEDFWALQDISFEVKQADRIGIIGRNGAGKSTLLKILSRITEPTTGSIRIKGRVASLLEVGTGFHPELTGRENIFLNGAILGMQRDEIRRKFDEIVDFAEIERFLDTPVKRYSSGMYVRLAFAVAAHLEPEILIVDEVLAVGDLQFQKKCLGKMEDVSVKEGRTVLFVSHNMEAIKMFCNRAIWLKNGKVAGEGEVNEQLDRYIDSDQNNQHIFDNNPIHLSPMLELRKFEFSPNPVKNGEKQDFHLEFWSAQAARIEAVTILIYSHLGMRVAIMDLRRPSLAFQMDGLNSLNITGQVQCLPLVEGQYRVGLYVEAAGVKQNFLNLATIYVLGKTHQYGIVPYSANVRGVVELDFQHHIGTI